MAVAPAHPEPVGADQGELERLLRPIKWIGAGDLTFTRVGQTLYRKERPDFFTVYLRGMDAMGHLYWNYMVPEALPGAEGFDGDAVAKRDAVLPPAFLPRAARAVEGVRAREPGR